MNLPQVGECFLDGLALAGDVDFESAGDVQVVFTVHCGGEGLSHAETVVAGTAPR